MVNIGKTSVIQESIQNLSHAITNPCWFCRIIPFKNLKQIITQKLIALLTAYFYGVHEKRNKFMLSNIILPLSLNGGVSYLNKQRYRLLPSTKRKYLRAIRQTPLFPPPPNSSPTKTNKRNIHALSRGRQSTCYRDNKPPPQNSFTLP